MQKQGDKFFWEADGMSVIPASVFFTYPYLSMNFSIRCRASSIFS